MSLLACRYVWLRPILPSPFGLLVFPVSVLATNLPPGNVPDAWPAPAVAGLARRMVQQDAGPGAGAADLWLVPRSDKYAQNTKTTTQKTRTEPPSTERQVGSKPKTQKVQLLGLCVPFCDTVCGDNTRWKQKGKKS